MTAHQKNHETLARAASGDPEAATAAVGILLRGIRAYFQCGGQVDLARCCGLPSPTARRKFDLLNRDYWLCEAARQIEADTSVLAAQLRDIASIQDQALAGRGEGEKAKADEAKAVLDKIKAELEALKAIPIGVDLPKVEAALLEANKRMQALLDANPLTQAVLVGGATGLDNLPAKAAGGLLRGPGTGTSDSILARVSNGEYVVRAAAVRKLGLANLNAINQGRMPALRAAAMRVMESRRLPRFADGGLISGAVGSLPRPASSGSGATSILNLTLPGVGTFETRADAAVADSLERALRTAALKHGRRV